MGHHHHDVHNVNVAIFIEVIVRVVAPVPTFASPSAGYLLDIRRIHDAVAI